MEELDGKELTGAEAAMEELDSEELTGPEGVGSVEEYNDELVKGDVTKLCEPEAILLSSIKHYLFVSISYPILRGVGRGEHSF
jgi:hypothetical protein